jgi:magnesium transporter
MGQVRAYVTASVPTAAPGESIGTVLGRLPQNRFQSVHSVFVVDARGALIGAAPLGEIYAAAATELIDTYMEREPPRVEATTDREDAASFAIKHELVAVPIVDADGRFLGVFPPRAIMDVLREEHLEDLHRMAGIWSHSQKARQALETSPLARARYRLPWLIVGLAGSMLATRLVAGFEHVLQSQLAVAFFMPAIVYLADAVGTQSEAVAVRGLSLTDSGIGRLLVAEIGTGVLMGLILGALAAAFTAVTFGTIDLAAAVGLSLLAACTIATSLGLCLPWAFAQLGLDPALASGPVGTIIQDVLSLLIYFSAATAILR